MKTKLAYGLLLSFAAFAFFYPFAHPVKAGSSEMVSGGASYAIYGKQLGTVDFPTSCKQGVQSELETGLALLHHMTYGDAKKTFEAASKADPECAMSYWGQAMSMIHPLWSDPPGKENFEKGRSLLKLARTKSKKDKRELAYINAVETYFAKGNNPKESINLAAFAKGWEKVHNMFPDDTEAAALYALAILGTIDPADKSYSKQKQAGAIAAQVLARIPDHPGAHHYTIHAFDYPALAKDALEVARSYGKIAPAVPHALHMPTHIFTRLGLWEESIAMNSRSASAALKHPAGDMISLHYLHALDYMAYAYLQQARDIEAKKVMEKLAELVEPIQPHVASAYTLAAVPARYALERQQWAAATRIQPRSPGTYPWDKFPAMEAVTYFARALRAAHTGDVKSAEQALEKLTALQKLTTESSEYWAKQVEIQRLSAKAWLTFQQDSKQEALKQMQEAAAMEASTEKHPVTPGEVLPARELLADMLFEMGKYREARAEYENALKRSTNRFNSLFGAGRAAELGGDKSTAGRYYRKLVDIAAKGDTDRERLRHAKKFLAGI